MKPYVKVGLLLQLPGSQVKRRPALGTPQITAPPPRGARGGDSLPSTNLPTSGAVTLAKPLRVPPGQCCPAGTSTKSITPNSAAGAAVLVRPPPLSPWQAVPPGAVAQSSRASASRPQLRL